MLLLRNHFYIIFIILWILGLCYILTTFHSTSNNDKILEDRIEYLQSEVDLLRRKLFHLQSGNNIDEQVRSEK